MRTPTFSHAAWFAAGAIPGGVAAGFLPSHPATGNSAVFNKSVVALPRKPNVFNPAQSAANPDPQSALRRAPTSPPGLPRSRDFLTFLETVDAGNWQNGSPASKASQPPNNGRKMMHLAHSQWLTANPGHLAYDTGAATLYLALMDTDPSGAAAWGAEVKDGSLRQWTHLDPAPPPPPPPPPPPVPLPLQ